MKRNFTALLLLLILSGCRQPEYLPHLSLSAQLMQERPDSALRLLQELNSDGIQSPADRARYALLYSEALEKNHIAAGSDSLVNSALIYYEKQGANEECAQTYYYLARIYSNQKDWKHTIRACVQAEVYAARIDNHELSGAIAAVKGNVYFECANYPHAITAYSKALDHYKQAGNDSLAMIVCNELSRAYAFDGNQSDAKKYFEQTKRYAETLHDTVNMLNAVRSMASYSLYESDDPALALETLRAGYTAYTHGKVPVSDYPLLSIIHLKLDQARTAWKYAHDYFNSQDTPTPLSYGLLADAEYAVGNFKESLLRIDQYLSLEDSLSLTTQKQLLTDAEQRYKNELLRRDIEQQRINTRNLLIIFLLSVVLFATAIVIIILQRKRQLLVKEAELLEAANALESIQSYCSKLDQISRSTTGRQTIINRQLVFMRDMLDMAGHYNGKEALFFAKFRKYWQQEATNKEVIAIFRESLGARYPGLLEAVRRKYPNLTEDDIDRYCIICSGCSGFVLSMIYNTSQSYAYNMRSNLRQKLGMGDTDSFEAHIQNLISHVDTR